MSNEDNGASGVGLSELLLPYDSEPPVIIIISSSCTDSTGYYDSLSPSVPIGHYLLSPLDGIQCPHRADECKFVPVS